MNNIYLRFSIYISIVLAVIFVPIAAEIKEIRPLYHQNKIIKISLVKSPVKKRVKRVKKKVVIKVKKKVPPKSKPKPKLKALLKAKPIVKKVVIEPVVVKREIVKEKKVEVKSKDIEAKKLELAMAEKAQRTYYDTIFEVIAQNKRYPKKARRYKQEGSIKVSFKVLSDGTIRDLKLLVSSKYKSLNRAVKKLFQRLEKFPAPPNNLSFPLELSITINYKLKR